MRKLLILALVALATSLVVSVPSGASFVPSPHHAAFHNQLRLENGECVGEIHIRYGFVPLDKELRLTADPQPDCSIIPGYSRPVTPSSINIQSGMVVWTDVNGDTLGSPWGYELAGRFTKSALDPCWQASPSQGQAWFQGYHTEGTGWGGTPQVFIQPNDGNCLTLYHHRGGSTWAPTWLRWVSSGLDALNVPYCDSDIALTVNCDMYGANTQINPNGPPEHIDTIPLAAAGVSVAPGAIAQFEVPQN